MSKPLTVACPDCGADAEVTREFVHSPRAVTIGFALLGVGVAGMIAALIWYLSLTSEVSAELSHEQIASEVRAALTTANVPEPLREKTARGESLTLAEIESLSQAQRKVVDAGWNRLNGRNRQRKAGNNVTGVAAFTIAIPCAATFLVAFPLIARRRVRRCRSCDGVGMASPSVA